MLKSRFRRRLEILEARLAPPAGKGMLGLMIAHSRHTALSSKALEASMADYRKENTKDELMIINVVDTDAEPSAAIAPLSPDPVDEEAGLAAEVRALELRRAELRAKKGKR